MGIIYSKCYNGVIMVPGFADVRSSDKRQSCSVKTVTVARRPRPAFALNHYYNDSEVKFCSRAHLTLGPAIM
jgi:hypothetical protein